MDTVIDPAQVADYLSKHPDFFNQFPDLLTRLSITHPHGTHAISITERQVLSMRDKVHLLESKLAELIRFGEENDSISENMHRLALDIVSARDLQALGQHLAALTGATFGFLGEAANSVGGYIAGAVPRPPHAAGTPDTAFIIDSVSIVL